MSAPTSLAYDLFVELCDVTTHIERLRERYAPGSDGWCALVELVQVLDGLIDALVWTDGLEEES